MTIPILYLGPEGTHSHEAARRHFGPQATLVPCLSHYEIFSRLGNGRTLRQPLAVVPVENSSEGPVTQTLDQLAHHPEATILDSFSLPILQHLLARPGTRLAGIRRVCSHPQALGQCRDTLARLLPRAELIPESSTAAAADRAAQDAKTAAIASDAAAKLHGLVTLRKNIQDGTRNVTRFFTVAATRRGRPAPVGAKNLRSLIYLVIGNRPVNRTAMPMKYGAVRTRTIHSLRHAETLPSIASCTNQIETCESPVQIQSLGGKPKAF